MQPSEPLEIVSGHDEIETVSEQDEQSKEVSEAEKPTEKESERELMDEENVHDVSGKTWELSLLDRSVSSTKGLYVYKNTFNLIPASIGEFERLNTLKFFANEINLFPSETRNLTELEYLQVKVSSPELLSLPFQNLKALKELELHRVPRRPSTFTMLSEIANLKCLKKLVVCHFLIRCLPPEIGSLSTLEVLDISFNKLKKLPNEISALSNLQSLKLASNKLVELPSSLSCLQKLEILDLSNNRLTSLGSINLASMRTLQNLNLQYNKLLNCRQIPSWICCNLEGNGKETYDDEFSSSVELDLDAAIQNYDGSQSCNGSLGISSSLFRDASSGIRGFAACQRRKGWKRRDYLQQKARHELLNNVRKWKSDDQHQIIKMNLDRTGKECNPSTHDSVVSECLTESSSLSQSESATVKDFDEDSRCALSVGDDSQILCNHGEDKNTMFYSISERIGCNRESGNKDELSLSCFSNSTIELEEKSCLDASNDTLKSKRHFDGDLDNPKPSKSRRPVDNYSNLSCKYNIESFCSINDRLLDGFYDPGRDRPFLPLQSYEQSLCLDSREVILVDREIDEDLNGIVLSAQALLYPLKLQNKLIEQREQLVDNDLQRASMLALFVSNWFGGCDKSNFVTRMRKAVAGSNYQKPFICTCQTGNDDNNTSSKETLRSAGDWNFINLCEKSLRLIKQARNSNVVPIGTIRWGVCRHRAILIKYLCDRVDPPIPCELTRGYLDFLPHAWNTILVRRNNLWVRMIVDACSPTDIREETDPEYFCRYIPTSRIHVSLESENTLCPSNVRPSLLLHDEVKKAGSSSIIQCKFGSVEGVAKVCTLEEHEASNQEKENFLYTFLGEVRMLSVLKKNSCIVEIYGHQISSKWDNVIDGNGENHLLQSAIVMEHIEGGSLNSYIKKLSKIGEKHVPLELALFIARDVACALVELHSKHIIHRDIKSENILIDLDRKRADNTPVVKLCDFDRAVPLRSLSHTCCIAHRGIHPPDICVGTPRWMAPEVLQAMHKRNLYGLEVDIWSFGCLLLELLTLNVPYAELPESEIHELLQLGQRPSLSDELDALISPDLVGVDAETGSEDTMKFLVDLFHQCTQGSPSDRPTAVQLYDMLNAHANSSACSES